MGEYEDSPIHTALPNHMAVEFPLDLLRANQGKVITKFLGFMGPWIKSAALAYLGWIVSLVAAFMVYGFAESFCPEEKRESGMCLAPWFERVERGIEFGTIALAACLVVAFPTLGALEGRKKVVSWVAFLGGTAFAIWLAVDIPESGVAWLELATAVASGFLTVCFFSAKAEAGNVEV